MGGRPCGLCELGEEQRFLGAAECFCAIAVEVRVWRRTELGLEDENGVRGCVREPKAHGFGPDALHEAGKGEVVLRADLDGLSVADTSVNQGGACEHRLQRLL